MFSLSGWSNLWERILNVFLAIVIGVAALIVILLLASCSMQEVDQINAENAALQCDVDLQMTRAALNLKSAALEKAQSELRSDQDARVACTMAREAAEESEAQCKALGFNADIPTIGR